MHNYILFNFDIENALHSSRCPKCHSLKKSKSSVSKTVSLEQRGTHGYGLTTREESRKSMPNLEHDLQHRHCCSSQDSLNATRSREYLQLVEDKRTEQDRGVGLGEQGMGGDLLSSCLQVSLHDL